MERNTTSDAPPTTGSGDYSTKSILTTDMRSKFEYLLEDSGPSDDEESALPETSDKDCDRINKERFETSAKSQSRLYSMSEDDPDEVILSMMWNKGTLGAAYYNVLTTELFVMDDIMDNSNHNVTKALFKQSQPRYVVMTTGIAEPFLNAVKKLVISDAAPSQQRRKRDDATSASTSFTVDSSEPMGAALALVPKKENTYETCYNRVLCLKLNCEPENASIAERKTFLSSLLNFKSRMMIHALGLLLKYVDANWNKLTLNPNGHAQFLHICYVMLDDIVMVDEDTYQVLDIVQPRFHPSLFKFGNLACTDHHGLSLFTLLHRCQSRPGVFHLWKLLRHPTRDTTVLRKRFEAVQFFLNPDNQNLVKGLKICLAHVYRLRNSILDRYSAPQAKASDWSRLHKTLSCVISIAEICSEHRDATSIFAKIADSVTPDMHVVRYFMEYILDFEVSKIQGKLVVKPGVDPELDELNNIREKLPQLLSEMAEKDMRKYSLVMESCRMIYVPDIRYVLAITEGAPSDEEMTIPGLEFKFTINGVRHYKSDGARELDDTLGDVVLKITKRQSKIILRLVRYISKHVGSIMKAIEYCAELDTLLSFAAVARDHNYVMPELVDSKTINIKRGRHPLKELLVNFVPNDTFSSDEASLVKILTGPNACGKSVYLKQVALIVFMAHIGSFVPAESATIGVVTHIFTQMNFEDNLAQNASSFLLSLRQINVALYASTPRSLLIMDEFGCGTSEVDGLALLTAVLESFIERGIQCPHIFAATHIHRVIELLPQIPTIEPQSFEYVSNEADDLIFLYRLKSGKTSGSFAHSVAKSAGLSNDIVLRALEVFEAKKHGKLPTPLPNSNQENTMMHIMEILCEPSGKIDLDELKLWLRQAMTKPTNT